jgi:hypothetical protein
MEAQPQQEEEELEMSPLVLQPHKYVVNIWKVQQHLYERRERDNLSRQGVFYAGLLVFFLYMMFNAFPWTSNSIKHEEALRDLLLDEEFSYDEVPNHKKSWEDIFTTGEMFQVGRSIVALALRVREH